MRGIRPGWWRVWLAILLLLPAGPRPGALAQQETPLLGRNRPPNGTTDIYVSAVVDHLVGIDDSNYRFEVVLYILLTWRDERAKPASDASTQAALNSSNGCDFPCTTIYAWTQNPEANNLCCDGVWLPHFEFINVRGFSQDRVVRYGVRFGPDNAVGWWTHVQGEFYCPLQFRSFPFDKQYLSVQLQYGNKFRGENASIRIIPSATGTQLYSPNTGDEISGWDLKGVHFKLYNLSEQRLLDSGGAKLSAPDDPWPVHPSNPSVPVFSGMLWQIGFELLIEVQRISLYFVLTLILPVYINTCLALLVFSVSPRHLDTRLGIVVTLFLSLTALQFVLASQLPSSATVVPTQQLVIVSYCILAGIGVSSIGVFWLVNLHRTRSRRRRLRLAKRTFSNRWQSVTSSLGMAAAAVAALQSEHSNRSRSLAQPTQRGQQEKAGWPSASAATAAAAPPQGAGKQAAAPPAARNLPHPAPFMTTSLAEQAPSVAAAAEQHPTSSTAPSPIAGTGEPAVAAEDKESAGSHQQAQLWQRQVASRQCRWQDDLAPADTLGPRSGGMGVYTGGSSSNSRSTSSDDNGGGDSSNNDHDSFASSDGKARRRSRAPARAPAPSGADEEEGGHEPRRWQRWRQHAATGCWGQPARGQPPNGSKVNWFRMQHYKFRLMKEEMRTSQDYAMLVATQVDSWIFWITLVGFNIAVIIIFAVQSQFQPEPFTP